MDFLCLAFCNGKNQVGSGKSSREWGCTLPHHQTEERDKTLQGVMILRALDCPLFCTSEHRTPQKWALYQLSITLDFLAHFWTRLQKDSYSTSEWALCPLRECSWIFALVHIMFLNWILIFWVADQFLLKTCSYMLVFPMGIYSFCHY